MTLQFKKMNWKKKTSFGVEAKSKIQFDLANKSGPTIIKATMGLEWWPCVGYALKLIFFRQYKS